MANTDKRDLILDNLVAAFAAMTTGGGYNFTIGEARRGRRDIGEVPSSSFPAVYVIGADEERENSTNSGYKSTMTISIIGYVKHTDAQDTPEIERQVSKLVQDMYKAANVDPTRGGYAVYTNAGIKVETDHGIYAPMGVVLMTITVEYRATFATP